MCDEMHHIDQFNFKFNTEMMMNQALHSAAADNLGEEGENTTGLLKVLFSDVREKGFVLSKSWGELLCALSKFQGKIMVTENSFAAREKKIREQEAKLEEQTSSWPEEVTHLKNSLSYKEKSLAACQAELVHVNKMAELVDAEHGHTKEILEKVLREKSDIEAKCAQYEIDLNSMSQKLQASQEELEVKDQLANKLEQQMVQEIAEGMSEITALKGLLQSREQLLENEKKAHNETSITLRQLQISYKALKTNLDRSVLSSPAGDDVAAYLPSRRLATSQYWMPMSIRAGSPPPSKIRRVVNSTNTPENLESTSTWIVDSGGEMGTTTRFMYHSEPGHPPSSLSTNSHRTIPSRSDDSEVSAGRITSPEPRPGVSSQVNQLSPSLSTNSHRTIPSRSDDSEVSAGRITLPEPRPGVSSQVNQLSPARNSCSEPPKSSLEPAATGSQLSKNEQSSADKLTKEKSTRETHSPRKWSPEAKDAEKKFRPKQHWKQQRGKSQKVKTGNKKIVHKRFGSKIGLQKKGYIVGKSIGGIHHLCKPTKCPVCHQIQHSITALNDHVGQEHPGVCPFRCKTCNKEFKDSRVRHTHERYCKDRDISPSRAVKTGDIPKPHPVLHSKSPKPTECPECHLILPSISAVQVHGRQVHPGMRLFKCKKCSREFSIFYNLKHHEERYHNGESIDNVDSDVTKKEPDVTPKSAATGSN